MHTSRKISKTFRSKNATKRSFQTAWFEQFKWLHHEERRDAPRCHTCLKALQSGMLTSSNADPAFTKNGFSNWKNAMEKKKGFQKHESSESHMKALSRFVPTPATVMDDIGDLLSERHALEKSKNRKILLPILSNIRYLARQALRIGTLSIKNVERREREPEARCMHTPLVATGYYVVMRGVRCRGRRSGCFHVIEKRKKCVINY